MKTFAGLEAEEWTFLTISVINVLVAIGITIDRLVELRKDTPDYTFAIILFINIGMFLSGMKIDGDLFTCADNMFWCKSPPCITLVFIMIISMTF